jgi:DNA-binding response OmpR family regulator
MRKILVADDEARIRKLINDFLSRRNFEVLEAENGYEALMMLKENNDIDLVILDVMMPIMDGWGACTEMRKFSNVHIIFLTANASEDDQLKGYALGVDEYVTKPFSPAILAAKIDAILSRDEITNKQESIPFVLDANQRIVFIDGKPVDLSFKEFELLSYFVKHKNVALSREKIIKDVWGDDPLYVDTRIIDTHIKKMRQKLGIVGDYIKTIRGFGYRFEA